MKILPKCVRRNHRFVATVDGGLQCMCIGFFGNPCRLVLSVEFLADLKRRGIYIAGLSTMIEDAIAAMKAENREIASALDEEYDRHRAARRRVRE